MDRVLCCFEFLFKLIKSNCTEYKRLIDSSSAEDVQAILCCASLCLFYRSAQFKNVISQLLRTSSIERAKLLLKRNKSVVCTVVCEILKIIVEMTISYIMDNGI